MAKLLLALAALSTASAFQAPSAASAARSMSLRAESSTALVPVNDENIATSSAVTAAGAGFLIGGPVVGAVTAAAGNYASKQENEARPSGVAARARGFGARARRSREIRDEALAFEGNPRRTPAP